MAHISIPTTIYASLDIGSAKTTMLIGQFDKENNVRIIGHGETKSHGVRDGIITNISATAQDIAQVKEDAMRMAGVGHIEQLFVNISGGHISYINDTGRASVLSELVTEEDKKRAIDVARSVKLEEGDRVLHTEVQYYRADHAQVANPFNFRGVRRLEVCVHLITCSESIGKNLRSCVQDAGLKASKIVNASLASAHSVCNENERNQGTIIIDIGSDTCDIVVYIGGKEQGYVIYSAVLPVGGRHATEDMAKQLGITREKAEALKLDYGCVYPSLITEDEEIALETENNQHKSKRTFITDAVHQRYREIMQLIHDDLQTKDILQKIGNSAQVILTGGGATVQGTKELASEIFGMNARVTTPNINKDLDMNDCVDSPRFATAIGLLMYAKAHATPKTKMHDDMQHQENNSQPKKSKSIWQKIWDMLP